MPFQSRSSSEYMSRREAAEYLGIPFERVKPLIDKGKLKALQRGKIWYVDRASATALKKRGF